ncbi:MAG: AAA family ATPase [Polyangiaceae bacterium]|nr:AAA family ATPase [Polyangiaceae bacterium]
MGRRTPFYLPATTSPLFATLSKVSAGSTQGSRPKSDTFVGRQNEVTSLLALVTAAATTSLAKAAIVLGSAGIGKSRVARELALQAAEHGIRTWMGRGDPSGRRPPFSALGDLLNRLCHITKDDTRDRRREKLRERIGRNLPADTVWETTAILGEAAGTSFFDGGVDDSSPAPGGPNPGGSVLLGDLALRAWDEFLTAELSQGPLAIILDDADRADIPTIRLLESSLRNGPNRPLAVVAFSRPTLSKIYPSLFAEARPLQLTLSELSPIASKELLKALTHDRLTSTTLDALAEKAGGNPFVLEGLAMNADAPVTDLPATVAGAATARFNAASSDTRRLLRAASVLGDVVSRADLAALLAGSMDETAIELAIEDACKRDLLELRATPVQRSDVSGAHSAVQPASVPLVPSSPNRWTGNGPVSLPAWAQLPNIAPGAPLDVAFRSASVRERAYASLNEEDRARVHLLAARRLGSADRDAATIAHHYEQAGQPQMAIEPYRLASLRALAANDFEGAVNRSLQAESCGATGPTLGEVLRIRADASLWMGKTAEAESAAQKAMGLLSPGNVSWVQAATVYAVAAARLGNFDALLAGARDIELLAAATPFSTIEPPLRVAQVVAMARLSVALLHAGDPTSAEPMLGRIHALRVAGALADLPFALGHTHRAHAIKSHIQGNLLAALTSFAAAAGSFERARALRDACVDHINAGFLECELGRNEDAEKRLTAAQTTASRLGLPTASANAQLNLCLLMGRRNAFVAAASMAETALAIYERQASARTITGALVYLSRTLVESGAAKLALERAERATRLADEILPYRAYAYATLAAALRSLGRSAEALTTAETAMSHLRDLGTEEGEAYIRLTHVEALHSAGRTEAARAALFEADARLSTRAGQISDPSYRESFLQNVPEHAKTIALAESLGVGSTSRATTLLASQMERARRS